MFESNPELYNIAQDKIYECADYIDEAKVKIDGIVLQASNLHNFSCSNNITQIVENMNVLSMNMKSLKETELNVRNAMRMANEDLDSDGMKGFDENLSLNILTIEMIEEAINEIKLGDYTYGDGPARVAALTAKYGEYGAEIIQKSIDNNYKIPQDILNDFTSSKHYFVTSEKTESVTNLEDDTPRPLTVELIKEAYQKVNLGEYGDGPARVAALTAEFGPAGASFIQQTVNHDGVVPQWIVDKLNSPDNDCYLPNGENAESITNSQGEITDYLTPAMIYEAVKEINSTNNPYGVGATREEALKTKFGDYGAFFIQQTINNEGVIPQSILDDINTNRYYLPGVQYSAEVQPSIRDKSLVDMDHLAE